MEKSTVKTVVVSFNLNDKWKFYFIFFFGKRGKLFNETDEVYLEKHDECLVLSVATHQQKIFYFFNFSFIFCQFTGYESTGNVNAN